MTLGMLVDKRTYEDEIDIDQVMLSHGSNCCVLVSLIAVSEIMSRVIVQGRQQYV